MCGLSALISQKSNGFTAEEQRLFVNLVCLTQFRGADSTGVVAVNKHGGWSLLRELGGPINVFKSQGWNKWYGQLFQVGKIAFNHGRAATKGTVNLDNAHPFVVEKPNKKDTIIFMHNGTLDIHQTLPDSFKFDVDSKWLASTLAARGPVETFGKVNGPIACIWWDTELETINFYRNNDRPLHVVQNKKTKDYYIQSDISSLMYLKFQFDLDYAEEDIEYFNPRTHYWMHYKETDKGWSTQECPRIEPVAHQITPYKEWPRQKQHNYYGLVDDYEDSEDGRWEWDLGEDDNKPVIIPSTEWRTMTRSYWNDVDNISKKAIVRVEFERKGMVEWQRKTVMPHGHFIDSVNGPYRIDLESMELHADQKTVLVNYRNGGTEWQQTETMTVPLISPPPKKEPNTPVLLQGRAPAVEGVFIKGTKQSWSSRHKGVEIQHNCQISETHTRHFTSYRNDYDGEFKLGDTVTAEMYEFTQRGKDLIEVDALRIGEMHYDEYVGVYFHMKDRSKESLEKTTYVRGKVHMIKLCTREEYEKTGYFVKLLINDIIEVIQEPTDDEESVVVMPNPKEPADAS